MLWGAGNYVVVTRGQWTYSVLCHQVICELSANMLTVSKTLIAAMSSSSCWSNDIWHGASSAANTSDEWPRDGPRLGHSDTLRHETSTYPDGLAERRMTMHCDADQGASQSHISSNWNKQRRISIILRTQKILGLRVWWVFLLKSWLLNCIKGQEGLNVYHFTRIP